MQEGEKSSVETTKTSARTPRASGHRSVLTWQSLLLMITAMLLWHHCALPHSTIQTNMHCWQGGVLSIKRQETRIGKKNSDANKVRGNLSGREYACSQIPRFNRLRKSLIEPTPNVVYNMQDGGQHVSRQGGRRKRIASDPGKVGEHEFCLGEDYWMNGKSTWELITLKNTHANIRFLFFLGSHRFDL